MDQLSSTTALLYKKPNKPSWKENFVGTKLIFGYILSSHMLSSQVLNVIFSTPILVLHLDRLEPNSVSISKPTYCLVVSQATETALTISNQFGMGCFSVPRVCTKMFSKMLVSPIDSLPYKLLTRTGSM